MAAPKRLLVLGDFCPQDPERVPRDTGWGSGEALAPFLDAKLRQRDKG